MPLIYGEGRKKPLIRLYKQIKESLNEDDGLFVIMNNRRADPTKV
jgi:hypothetical protein